MAYNNYHHYNKISQNAQKILFAEDLVNHILRKYSIPAILFSTERQRKSCVSIFDENLRMTADIFSDIIEEKTDEICHFFMKNNLCNMLSFYGYAHVIRKIFLEGSHYTHSFYHYSVHLTSVAAKLYAQGLKDSPRAVGYIIKDAMNFDLFMSGREILDRFAQNYADNLRRPCNAVQRPPLYKKDKLGAQAIDVQMCTPHGNLNRCEVTAENIHGDVFNMEKLKEVLATIPSSFNAQSHSGFENNRTHVFDHTNINSYNMSSSDYVGAPGSFRQGSTNIYSQECYSLNYREDKMRQ